MHEPKYHRRSLRLPGYDYSQYGWYFVTVCVKDREELFGTCVGGKTALNAVGNIADQYWREIPEHFASVELDEYVIMPNHVHGIVIINDHTDDTIRTGVGFQRPNGGDVAVQRPYKGTNAQMSHISPRAGSLSAIIRSYKSAVTAWCRTNGHQDFQWHRNYFERVIRDDAELAHVRAYISNNPINWALDEENPQVVSVPNRRGVALLRPYIEREI